MNPPTPKMKRLVLDVQSLCARTIAFAERDVREPGDMTPLLLATESVWRTLEILQAELAADSISPALPSVTFFDPEAVDDWLFGVDDAEAARKDARDTPR